MQFLAHVNEEAAAQASERFVDALGTTTAIAQAFGTKDALKGFRKMLSPESSPGVGRSSDMQELARRMRASGMVRTEER